MGRRGVADLQKVVEYAAYGPAAAHIRIDLYPDADGYGKQFKYATGRGIRYALLLGSRELEAGVVAAKDLESGDQEDVALDEIVSWLSERV